MSKLLSDMLTSSKAARSSAGWYFLTFGAAVGSKACAGVGRIFCSAVGGEVDDSNVGVDTPLGEVDRSICGGDSAVGGDR